MNALTKVHYLVFRYSNHTSKCYIVFSRIYVDTVFRRLFFNGRFKWKSKYRNYFRYKPPNWGYFFKWIPFVVEAGIRWNFGAFFILLPQLVPIWAYVWEQSIDLTDQWCSFMHREPIVGLYLLVVSIVYLFIWKLKLFRYLPYLEIDSWRPSRRSRSALSVFLLMLVDLAKIRRCSIF